MDLQAPKKLSHQSGKFQSFSGRIEFSACESLLVHAMHLRHPISGKPLKVLGHTVHPIPRTTGNLVSPPASPASFSVCHRQCTAPACRVHGALTSTDLADLPLHSVNKDNIANFTFSSNRPWAYLITTYHTSLDTKIADAATSFR